MASDIRHVTGRLGSATSRLCFPEIYIKQTGLRQIITFAAHAAAEWDVYYYQLSKSNSRKGKCPWQKRLKENKRSTREVREKYVIKNYINESISLSPMVGRGMVYA